MAEQDTTRTDGQEQLAGSHPEGALTSGGSGKPAQDDLANDRADTADGGTKADGAKDEPGTADGGTKTDAATSPDTGVKTAEPAGKTDGKSNTKTGDGAAQGKPAAAPRTNRLGLLQVDYKGGESTLCNGCGHDAISQHIIKACFELGVEQHRVAKLSGIGCSSKTPAYFLGRAHGFNSVHGRMPSVATGASLANSSLVLLGVSGDGDTASIGMGQFIHIIRRNVPMLYIIENNGVYGLTKGQFSATADLGSRSKGGVVNEMPPVDLCGLALELGCTFVARSFSGDPRQMGPLIKAALSHRGTAVIDVISPCVTFNDHEGSTKSHKAARDGEIPLHGLGFVPFFEQITADYEPGTTKEVTFPDGSKVLLKKLDQDYDPTNRAAAMALNQKAKEEHLFLTGLLYVNPKAESLAEKLDLPAMPLVELPAASLRPDADAMNQIMDSLS